MHEPRQDATTRDAVPIRIANTSTTIRLWAEWMFLFIVVPAVFAVGIKMGWMSVRLMFPLLYGFTLLTMTVMVLDRTFPKRRLWNARALIPDLGRIFAIALVAVAAMGVATWALDSGLLTLPGIESERITLFGLPRFRPTLWIAIMCLYPILSVYPQELIYRPFLHHRYRLIFRTPTSRILAGAIAFGYMHIFFLNWIAPVLTFAGGLLFSWTYERTQSTFAASVEHALYGCFIFTIGLGSFFYGGAIGT